MFEKSLKITHSCGHGQEWDPSEFIYKYLNEDGRLERYKQYLANGICPDCYIDKSTRQ